MSSLKTQGSTIFTHEMVMDLIEIYRFNGKEFYYNDMLKSRKDFYKKSITSENTFFFCKLLNISVTEPRLKALCSKDLTPKNKNEEFIINIKKSFMQIQDRVNGFEYVSNQFLELGRYLYKGIQKIDYNKKEYVDKTELIPSRKVRYSKVDLDDILELFEKKLNLKEEEITLLVTSLYVDFSNSNIFNYHNEEIGFLLLYIALFKEAFGVFQYISFFRLFYLKREDFKKALLQASFNWNEGYSQISTYNILIKQLILEAYQELERIVKNYEFDLGLNKSDTVENTIMKLDDMFTKADIKNVNPYISESTIDRTLARLKEENKIRALGTGRSAKWLKINEEPVKFNNTKLKGLFDYDEN